MPISPKMMREVGMTEKQIIHLLELELAEQREQNRIRQRNHRTRNASHVSNVTGVTRESYKEESKKERKKTLERHTRNVTCVTSEEFDQFWKLYPRHEAKKAAIRAFEKARKEAPLEAILNKLRAAKEKWTEEKYTPYPATWLNREGWDAEPATNGNGHIPSEEDLAIWRSWSKPNATKTQEEVRRDPSLGQGGPDHG